MLEFLRRLLGRAEPASDGPHREKPTPSPPRFAEEQFLHLVAGVRDYAIFLLDDKGYVQTWNAGAEQIKGYGANEIIGQHFSRFYPPEGIASGLPEEELKQATATGRFEEEGWRLRKDGSRFWASVVVTALRDQSGALRGFLKITRDLTERKKAEEEARRLLEEESARRAAEASLLDAQRAHREERRHREQLHVTLSSIGDAVIVTDMQGVVTFMNPIAQELTGWTPADAAGRPLEEVFRIVNEGTRQPVENPVAKVLREGIIVGLANHTVLIARDGGEVAIDDSAAPIRGEEGAVAGVVLVFRDVTELRRAGETRQHLAAIVESSDDAIISKTLDGIIVSWNRSAERLYGYTASEVVGQPISILIPPDHPEELSSIMQRLRRGQRIDHFETVRVCKDGSRLDVSLTISPIKNADGRIIGASKIARDITSRKRTEAALRFLAQASEVLAGLVDVPSTLQRIAALAVPTFSDWCAVDMLDESGGLQRMAVAHTDPAKVELAYELHRRYPPDRDAGVGTWHILRTGQPEYYPNISDTILKDNTPDEEMLELVRSLGLRSYIGVPLLIQGKPIGTLVFVAAESKRQYTAEDLQMARDLAHRASIAIENARLYSELKEADRRKDEWIAMLAHELRNPLAPIRNSLHLMKMPDVREEDLARARDISERQIEYMVRLVDDLLDVSRILRGRIELRKELVDAATVIERAMEMAQPTIDTQGQTLHVSLPTERLVLHADATRLAQVIANLLQNAAKFSERSGRIWLEAERTGMKGDELTIRVRDEGVGIRREALDRVFDLFFQANRNLERGQTGLGIGLTIVRQLVELHGGAVSVHSEGIGEGSEFSVRLPGLLPESTDAESTNGPPPVPSTSIPPRRILIVDDNVDAAISVAMLLKPGGHDLRLAYNGPQALAVAEEYRPEIILLDIGLPGLNGYEVARKLRTQPEFATIPLIAMTGYGQEDDRRRSEEAGFDRHLTKPIDPDVLHAILASFPGNRD